MVLKTNLDTEKEEFFAFLWLMPLIPMLTIFVLCLCYGYFAWVVLPIAFLWFVVWGNIYRSIHSEIYFDDGRITLKSKRKMYTFSVTDIMYIEENMFHGNPLRTHTYKLFIDSSVEIPSAYLFIRNRKIQKYFSKLFPDIPVKKNIVLE